MSEQQKTILFLCTANHYRSRFAEILFISVAGKMGLAWNASSRGLAIEWGFQNAGPMPVAAINALEDMGIHDVERFGRRPAQVTLKDLENADMIVALKHAEHLPLLQDKFPAIVERVEFWHVDDAPEAVCVIERKIIELVVRLRGSGGTEAEPSAAPARPRERRRAHGATFPPA